MHTFHNLFYIIHKTKDFLHIPYHNSFYLAKQTFILQKHISIFAYIKPQMETQNTVFSSIMTGNYYKPTNQYVVKVMKNQSFSISNDQVTPLEESGYSLFYVCRKSVNMLKIFFVRIETVQIAKLSKIILDLVNNLFF